MAGERSCETQLVEDTHSYIQTQATISAIINMIVNPAVSWLGNRDMQVTPLTGVAVDMAITPRFGDERLAQLTHPDSGHTLEVISGQSHTMQAGRIRMPHLGNIGLRCRRVSTACMACL